MKNLHMPGGMGAPSQRSGSSCRGKSSGKCLIILSAVCIALIIVEFVSFVNLNLLDVSSFKRLPVRSACSLPYIH